MSENLLFDTSKFNKETHIGETCNNCKHRQRWQCNSVVVQYCGVRKSNRTENRLLKIKCKTQACPLFEKGECINKSK